MHGEAFLTRVIPKGEARRHIDVPQYFSFFKRVGCSDIIEECYSIYKSIGLGKDAVHELLECGISDNDYIRFIEEKTGKSLIDIYREMKSEKQWELR